MLTKFSVTNFRNFKEKLSIDFTQEHDYKFNTECVNNKTISKIVVFGNNGEGKSNFGFAMFDIVRTITDLFVDTRAYDVKNFLNADSDLDYAEFNYEFRFGEDIVKYNYKDVFPLKELEFEGYKFYAPCNYDAMLKAQYGNYMEFPPLEKITRHILDIKFNL